LEKAIATPASSATSLISSAQAEREDTAAVDSNTPAPTETLTNPPQTVNPTAAQIESTVEYQNALSAGATPEEAAAISQQSLGAGGAGVSTTPIESTVAYQNALAAGATPEEAVIAAQRSIGAGGTTPIQQINRET
jgi:hypothetical protein